MHIRKFLSVISLTFILTFAAVFSSQAAIYVNLAEHADDLVGTWHIEDETCEYPYSYTFTIHKIRNDLVNVDYTYVNKDQTGSRVVMLQSTFNKTFPVSEGTNKKQPGLFFVTIGDHDVVFTPLDQEGRFVRIDLHNDKHFTTMTKE